MLMENVGVMLLQSQRPMGGTVRETAQPDVRDQFSEGRIMERITMLGAMGMVLAGLVFAATCAPGEDPKRNAADSHAVHFNACAKACGDCARECESCARHCADLIVEGRKEHMVTLGDCADCAEFCTAAAKIVSRRGPMSAAICESCAKACDVCGAACEKFPSDEHMKRCAQECRTCAKACRDMLQGGSR
jgi:hypothetical protein